MAKIAIFGLGYTGSRILKRLRNDNEVLGISRQTIEGDSVLLDVTDPEALDHFVGSYEASPFDFLIITFPVHNLPNSESLLRSVTKISREFWLLGTTSIYQRNGSDITEKTPLDPNHDRFQIEMRFLELGGHILRLSGIYGPNRNPADWIRKRQIIKTKRQLNLIHGDDIAETVRMLFAYQGEDLPPEMVLADNQWHTWLEIFRFLEDHGKIQATLEQDIDREDAFVDSGLIRKFLPGLQTKDFWRELEILENLP